MLVPKDFDFAKQLASFFPATGHEHASVAAAVGRGDQHNTNDNAGDGADRDASVKPTPETTPETKPSTTTGEPR
jgi:hypothetical protein